MTSKILRPGDHQLKELRWDSHTGSYIAECSCTFESVAARKDVAKRNLESHQFLAINEVVMRQEEADELDG